MTTFTELQAQMTGPGGPFETQTEVIDTGLGEVEMTMYAQRFGDLRQVAQFAALAHGDKEFIVYGVMVLFMVLRPRGICNANVYSV